jgi:hypothetical protein
VKFMSGNYLLEKQIEEATGRLRKSEPEEVV